MNTYIQDKLDEFDEKYDQELAETIKDVLSATKDSVHIHNFVRERITDALTDYHNHIVEIVEDCKREDIDEQMEDLQLNIIAETYDTKLQAFYWGGNCMVDKIVPLLKNTLYDKETNN